MEDTFLISALLWLYYPALFYYYNNVSGDTRAGEVHAIIL